LAERPWASSISVQATAPCLQATCSAVLPDSVADAASIVPASSSACSAAPLSAMIFFSIGLGRKLGWGGAAAEAEARVRTRPRLRCWFGAAAAEADLGSEAVGPPPRRRSRAGRGWLDEMAAAVSTPSIWSVGPHAAGGAPSSLEDCGHD